MLYYMNLTFIGNCQSVSLCFYFQQLLIDWNIQWVLYGDEFKMHLGEWSHKTKNKILNYDISIDVIKKSDFIIYQEISKEKSLFCNTETLQSIKKESCRLIIIPSIYFDYSDISTKELKKREIINKVDISVLAILEKYKDRSLMIATDHPNTFLFLEIVNELCKILNVNTFTKFMRDLFLEDNNYMKLPT